MKVVYVAGAYSSDLVLEGLNNIGRGLKYTTMVLEAGFAPFCPWADCLYVMMKGGDSTFNVKQMYEYSMEFLRRCDCVLVIPDWENSKGTKLEIEEADRLGIPVYYCFEELVKKEK